MRATELYALCQGRRCQGRFECYWCGAPCGDLHHHDGDPVREFVRNPMNVLRPANPYMCEGCWLWRRPSQTVSFLGGGLVDRKCPLDFSWVITRDWAGGVRGDSDHYRKTLFTRLMNPAKIFCLSLIDGEGQRNHLQTAMVNELDKVGVHSEITFTLNGLVHTYTPYDLDKAIKGKVEAGGGVQVLLRLFGPYKVEVPEEDKRGRGRPRNEYNRTS